MGKPKKKKRALLTDLQKANNNFEYYRERSDVGLYDSYIVTDTLANFESNDRVKNYRDDLQMLYNLYNNIIDKKDYSHVTDPVLDDKYKPIGNMPVKIKNYDIVSGKLKYLQGLAERRPVSGDLRAINPEAINEEKELKFESFKDRILADIKTEFQIAIEEKKKSELLGRKLSIQESKRIKESVIAASEEASHEYLSKNIHRNAKSSYTIMYNLLLNVLKEIVDEKQLYREGFKHLIIGGIVGYYVGELNNELVSFPINPLDFTSSQSNSETPLEKRDTFHSYYYMTTFDIIKYFRSTIDDTDVKAIHEYELADKLATVERNMFETENIRNRDPNKLQVSHFVWKDFDLMYKYINIDTGVTEYSTFKPDDIESDKIWVPKYYETWLLGDILLKKGPVSTQYNNINNPYDISSPYCGRYIDSLNSRPVSILSRIASFQKEYNIIKYRLNMLLASNEGKKILMNMKYIPKQSGIDISEWMYFFKSSAVTFFSSDESDEYTDANAVAKVIDLSVAKDIDQYIGLLRSIKEEAGTTVGIPATMEGDIPVSQSVGNTNRAVMQTSYILSSYMVAFDEARQSFLKMLLRVGKKIYAGNKSHELNGLLDAYSLKLMKIDFEKIEDSAFMFDFEDAAKTNDLFQLMDQQIFAAMQQGTMTLYDTLKVKSFDSLAQSIDFLEELDRKKKEEVDAIEKQRHQEALELQDKIEVAAEQAFNREKEIIILKAEEDRKTELAKAAMLGYSFNPDVDKNENGVNDYLDEAKKILSMKLSREKASLDERKFQHKVSEDKKRAKTKK